MPASVNQRVATSGLTGTDTTVVLSISNTQAGATLHLFHHRFLYDYTTISSIVDTQGNTWTQLGTDQDIGAFRYGHFVAQNIVGGAGANTITITFSGTNRWRFLHCTELRGVQLASLDGHNIVTYATPGTGTDAIAASFSNTVQPGIINAVVHQDFIDANYTVGTGFTDGGGGDSGGGNWRAEHKLVTSVGSQSATFTTDKGTYAACIGAAYFKELTANVMLFGAGVT